MWLTTGMQARRRHTTMFRDRSIITQTIGLVSWNCNATPKLPIENGEKPCALEIYAHGWAELGWFVCRCTMRCRIKWKSISCLGILVCCRFTYLLIFFFISFQLDRARDTTFTFSGISMSISFACLKLYIFQWIDFNFENQTITCISMPPTGWQILGWGGRWMWGLDEFISGGHISSAAITTSLAWKSTGQSF